MKFQSISNFYLLLSFILLYFSFVEATGGKILTIYSDEGTSGNAVWTWPYWESFDENNQDFTSPPEGNRCYKTRCTGSYAGWGVVYDLEQNLSEYQGGDLRFWIYSTTGNIKIEIEAPTGNNNTPRNLTQYGWNDSYVNTWRHFRIPLSDFNLATSTAVKSPFKITVLTQATFYVDLVRWTTNFALSEVQIKIKDVETHIEKSSITFSRVNLIGLPTSWVVADQYIELNVDIATTSWGIRIYTDNTSADANPKYTGVGNPAGLVDTTTTTKRLPMGWTIEHSTRTFFQLGTGKPGSWVSGGYQWKWFKDRNTQSFIDAKDYVTVWNNRGLLWNDSDRDSKNTPNYIYLSADFTTAVTPRTYKTSTLRIELYYE